MASEANLDNIGAYLKQFENDHRIPPVQDWHSAYCGEMDVLIKANGEWWHEGRPILRQKMIDLFAKILWKEGDDYFLKTPVEKIKIQVEDAPLLITEVDQIDIQGVQYLQLTTQNQDKIIVDEDHPIFMRKYAAPQQTPIERPYVHVRFGLDALIQRQAFYHLVNYGELYDEPNGTCLKLSSGSMQFTLTME